MSAHTPGPWRTNLEAPTLFVLSAPVPNRPARTICKLFEFSRRKRSLGDEVSSNALLIAAAPEMLEALKDALAAWKREADFGDGIDESNVEIYERARAAIAKAEGQS